MSYKPAAMPFPTSSRQQTERALAAARIATAAAEPVRVASAEEIAAASDRRRQRSAERSIGRWLLLVAAMVMAMIVLGALTRLTESGLSMVEWRPVTGWLPPLSEQAWQVELEKYAASPQGRIVNRNMTVDQFKEIYWLEYLHRLWGRLIGLAFALPLAWFWLRGMIPGWLKPRLVALLLLGGLQGVVGWLMVASGLIDRPAVSHFRLAAHLLLAVAILGWLFWLALALLRPNPVPLARHAGGNAAITSGASWLIVALVAVMTFGAFTAGLRAGQVHNSFPTMSGYWLPPGLLELTPTWLNFVATQTGVQFVHRWLAKLLLLGAVLLWLRSRRDDVAPPVRSGAMMVLAMACIQFGLGVSTLLEGVPVWLGTLHQAGAVLLLATLVLTLYRAAPAAAEAQAAWRPHAA
jgi:cytochrome c oxidase assembly protein subunit 15